MGSVYFSATTDDVGLVRRDFTVGDVSGALWLPESVTGRAPLVLLGHGGGRDSRSAPMVGRARRLVAAGFAVAAIDAPGHGGRALTPSDEREIAVMQQAMAAGEPLGPIILRFNGAIAERAVPEWRATLDALQRLPQIGEGGPVGYFGLNMGTAIGVPLVAIEPRITAAVLGMFWCDDALAALASRITVPVEFVLQWHDQHIPRETGLALFDAIGSAEKSLHANAGGHKDVPRFEADSAVRFYSRHLKPATAA